MATITAPFVGAIRRPSRPMAVSLILLGWLAGWAVLRGRDTLFLDTATVSPLHQRINDFQSAVDGSRNGNPLFVFVLNPIRVTIDALVTLLQRLIAQPFSTGHPAPLLGWLGVYALAVWVAWAIGNVKVALLTAAGFLSFGVLGLWQESMDSLALTLGAVFVSLLIGIPLGVWAGLSARFDKMITPVLDFMQVMPTFVYLSPLVLVFLIGPASAVIATAIYAVPPVIRVTAHGIRSVPRVAVEASVSLGATPAQTLTKVLLPMARRTITVGINQTIMAALSMVTIAALIAAPGLGQSVIAALTQLDVGAAFTAGLALVIMAIVLDRVTTAASQRVDSLRGMTPRARRWRRPALAVGAVAVVVCAYQGYRYNRAAIFPTEIGVGGRVAAATNAATGWVQDHLAGATGGFKNAVVVALIDPTQNLLVQSPWYLIAAVVLSLSAVLGGWRTVGVSAACLVVIWRTDLWYDAMTTLAATLVAAAVTVFIGVVVGVWMGRSRAADRVVRPFLDAAQTMPPFVYLIPFFALFDVGRFTAIAAAVVFAAPVSIKLVAEGITAVPVATVEAARSAGTSTWQMITKVQLPMARGALLLAVNQGLIYVLSMVVIGGLVGGGALGYDVVAGFEQSSLFGKGLAAGLAVVILGIMLDRITQAAARQAARTRAAH